jgi:hypothetical protein
MTDKRALLERYKALGEEKDFLAAKPLFEQAIAQTNDPELVREGTCSSRTRVTRCGTRSTSSNAR